MGQRESSPRWSRLLFFTILLTLFLSACGSSGSTSNTQSGTTSNQAATPVGRSVAALDLVTYQSKVLSIDYPHAWQKIAVGDNVTFTSEQTGYLSIEVIPNPDGLTSVSTGVMGSVNGLKATFPDHFTQEQMPDTTTINGITWNQSGITGSSTTKGITHSIKAIVLGTNHPNSTTNTKLFLVIYTSDTSNFDQLAKAAFEPMLASLKLINA